MLVILADITVILCCGYIGWLMAYRLEGRISHIEEFEKFLIQLSFNIEYLALPLKVAIEKAIENQIGVVKDISVMVIEFLDKSPDTTMSEAWNEAIKRNQSRLYIKTVELNALIEFAKAVGKGNCRQNIDNIRITLAKLDVAKTNAIAEMNKNGKLYKGTGFLVGMLVVILLF